jgi:DNA-binding CsgD family transcriptional regulator
MYFSILAVYVVFFLRLIHSTLTFFLVLHFSYNIPPLIYLGRYIKKHHSGFALSGIDEGDLDSFFLDHHITPREREVIMLLLKGKKTKDVEKELFISYHTAKNHIHNIYQKLHVQNRLQMAHLIKSHHDRVKK